jgi:hypothetical protein
VTGGCQFFCRTNRPLAEFILARLHREPVEFVYWGGSSPGLVRQVLVTEVFQLSEEGAVYAKDFAPNGLQKECSDWIESGLLPRH